MTYPVGIPRICLMAEDGGDGQDGDTRAGLPARGKDALDRALRSAGADQAGAWRQDRGGRHLLLLPVGTAARGTVPRLLRALAEQLERDRTAAAGSPAPPLRVALAQGTVTQARGGYAGQAIIAVSRLLDSPGLRAALSSTPEALYAAIISDELYGEAIVKGDGTMPAGSFDRVTVEAPDNLWQGVGWIRAWGVPSAADSPSAAAAVPAKKERGSVLDGVLPALAGGINDVASSLGAHGAETGAVHATDTAHLSAAHTYGAEHGYAVQETIQQGPGYIQETVVHTGYEDGTGYNSADYHSSSGADYHSSGGHSDGVA